MLDAVDLDSPLARRIKRIATVAAVLAIAATVLGMFPGERVWVGCFSHEPCSYSEPPLRTHTAGGLGMFVLGAGAALGALAAYRRPTRAVSTLWTIVTLLAAAGGFAIWFSVHFELFEHVETTWTEPAMAMLAGALLFLVLLVLPIVTWTSARTATDDRVPAARVR